METAFKKSHLHIKWRPDTIRGPLEGTSKQKCKGTEAKKALGGGMSKGSEEPSFLYSLFFMSSMSESLQIFFVVALWIPKHNLDASHIRAQDFGLQILSLLLDRTDGAVARPEFVADAWCWLCVVGRRRNLTCLHAALMSVKPKRQ